MDTKAKAIILKNLAPANAAAIKGGLPAVQKR